MKITMAQGSGGKATDELIHNLFAKELNNEILAQMEDSAVVPATDKIAVTTDSFVVTPIEYPGGDIGRLCVCGTVNDLLMRGAIPKYLTCGFILQEGADTDILAKIVHSMAITAKESGVNVIAGDTKVVEGNDNAIGGIMVNTTGIGFLDKDINISAQNAQDGDVILLSGTLGEHHAAILSSRLSIENTIASDNAPLLDMVTHMLNANLALHTMRDVTRGGLATVLKELAVTSGTLMEIDDEAIPVTRQVKEFCGLLGLDPLYMGNEGKLVAILPESEGQKALDIIRRSDYGKDAAIIGRVLSANENTKGKLVLTNRFGGRRMLDVLTGEGLPRIC